MKTQRLSRQLRWLLAHALLVFILILFGAGAQAQVKVVGGLTQRFIMAAGESQSGAVELENTGEEAAEVLVYKADYYFAADAGTTYDEPGTFSRSNAPWLRLGASPVVVPPNDRVSVPFELNVPENSAIAGTYWSVIMIEPVPLETANAAAEEDDAQMQVGISQRLRYAVQVITDVGETGRPRLVPATPKLGRNEDGAFTFQVDLRNEGTRWIVPAVWIELYNQTGELVGRFEGRQPRIYPDTSVRETITLGELQPGRYQAVLIADGGGSAVFGARYSFAVSEE